MPMSLLADFDVVVEITRSQLRDYMRTASFAGGTLVAPTELVSGDQANGIDLIVSQPVDLVLDPSAAHWATIVLPFEDSAITVLGTTAEPVAGQLLVHGVFMIAPAPGSDPTLTPRQSLVTFQPRSVSHTFDETIPYCKVALAALGDRNAWESGLDQVLQIGLSQQSLAAGPPLDD